MTKKEMGIVIGKLEALHEDVLEVKKAQGNLFRRINDLEKQQSWFKGLLAALGAVFGGAITWLWRHLLDG